MSTETHLWILYASSFLLWCCFRHYAGEKFDEDYENSKETRCAIGRILYRLQLIEERLVQSKPRDDGDADTPK